MELIFLTLAILAIFGIGLSFAKGTMLSVSEGHYSIWAFLFYKEVVLIFSPIVLLAIYSVDNFHVLKMVKQDLVFTISLWVVFSFAAYFFLYILLLRLIFRSNLLFVERDELFDRVNERKIYLFSIAAISSGLILLSCSILFLGYEHAFLASIIMGKNVLHVRLENVYASSLPTQISYVISVSYWVSAIFAAYLLLSRNKLGFLLVFSIGMILASAGGAKAPVVQYIMLFVMAYVYISRPRISVFKVLFYLPLYMILLLTLIYYVVSLQVPDLDLLRFLKYLFDRLGIGQMAGVYETLSIGFQSYEYGWHMIPFASFFVDYPVFSKELMLFTEKREFSDTGVKNSLFIAEAFGIGGTILMVVSPFVMAFAYLIKGFLLFYSLRCLFGSIVTRVYFMPIFFLSTSLTGDFSSFVFQKGTILLLLVLGLFYLVKLVVQPFVLNRSNVFVATVPKS